MLLQTANQSVFLLHALAQLTDVQERLYSELTSVLGNSKFATPELLAKMPYLKGCILESFRYYLIYTYTSVFHTQLYMYQNKHFVVLRLHSTAQIFLRVLAEDTTMLGYHVPKEVRCMIVCLYCDYYCETCMTTKLKFACMHELNTICMLYP